MKAKKPAKANKKISSSKSIRLKDAAVKYLAKPSRKLQTYSYNDLKQLMHKSPFTIGEWASFLDLSERTLQRYAKENAELSSIYSDRIRQIKKVLDRGIEVFGDQQRFDNWIRSNPFMLEGRLSLDSLKSTEGIQNILTQLGRIEHGLFA